MILKQNPSKNIAIYTVLVSMYRITKHFYRYRGKSPLDTPALNDQLRLSDQSQSRQECHKVTESISKSTNVCPWEVDAVVLKS